MLHCPLDPPEEVGVVLGGHCSVEDVHTGVLELHTCVCVRVGVGVVVLDTVTVSVTVSVMTIVPV